MTYKTIIVHLDRTGACRARTDLAREWARTHGSHLVGLISTGLIDGVIPAEEILSGATDYIAESAQYLRRRAEAISYEFRERVSAGGPMSYEVRLIDATTVDAVVQHGRMSDLVVLGQRDDDEVKDITTRDLPQRVVMEVGRPVLLVPYAGHFEGVAKNVVVAWDGSRESAVALGAAVPALRHASKVTLLSVRAVHDNDADERLRVPDILQYLLRHGIQATAESEVTGIDVGDALLSRISDLGADLLVMGGYGHSRFRELMLGGATRHILAQMTVPVLMTH
ncbi:universal stress protein [Variovorax sp. dw_308]|uniref:universal stress protein n=1 Tax=Variovorax sp. dw_308 TaxID=2721546 RepID=UPI001C4945F9|nr:universal stress protein [Variovorax sp. dw_308]